MHYAKVNENTVIQFPYSRENLLTENQYTRYDNRYNLCEWYAKTNEAHETGNIVVPVIIEEKPNFDEITHSATLQENPKLINDEWILSWEITEINSISYIANDSSV